MKRERIKSSCLPALAVGADDAPAAGVDRAFADGEFALLRCCAITVLT